MYSLVLSPPLAMRFEAQMRGERMELLLYPHVQPAFGFKTWSQAKVGLQLEPAHLFFFNINEKGQIIVSD